MLVVSVNSDMKYLLIFVLMMYSCTQPFFESDRDVSLLSLNTQTFFDDNISGLEFSEFTDPEKWNSKLYHKRLHNLGVYLNELDYPDIVLFQEIENIRVLEDLRAREIGTSVYPYYGCSGGDSVIHIGYMSKLPVRSLTQHQPPGVNGFEPRNFLEVVFMDGDFELKVINVHLKSNLQGPLLTSAQRNAEAEHILSRAYASEGPLIIAGDFNQEIEINSDTPSLGYVTSSEGLQALGAYFLENSFWNHSPAKGSYYYKGVWEKIDNIFWRDVTPVECTLIEIEGLSVRNGKPFKWNGRDGCSDHLGLYSRFSY